MEHLEQDEKVLEIREAPAAMLLMEAYKHLEVAVHSTDLLTAKGNQEQIWTLEAVEGRWGSSLHRAAREFVKSSTQKVTGTVSFQLEKGLASVTSIVAAAPLYLTDRDRWEVLIAGERSQRFIVVDNDLEILENIA